jgi:CubicO group peptidase (beta-lactamase class C family)
MPRELDDPRRMVASHRLASITLALAGIAYSGAPAAEDRPRPVPARFSALARELASAVADGMPPAIAVAIVRNGRVVWEAGFGVTDREARTPATEHSQFAVGSVVKSVTASTLMRLAERGAIDLDAPLGRYLPGAVKARAGGDARITARALLSMTAGIPHFWYFVWENDHDEIHLRTLLDQSAVSVFPPGETYHYSNLGFGIAEQLIASVARAPVTDVVAREVFAPLKMRSSCLCGPENTCRPLRYAAEGVEVRGLRYQEPVGGAGLVSSAHDLALFAAAHLGHEPSGRGWLSATARAQMHRSMREAWHYGLGWGVDDAGALVSDGAVLGGAGIVKLMPRDDVAAVVVTNAVEKNSATYAFVDRLLAAELGRELTAPRRPEFFSRKPFTPSAQQLGAWSGAVEVSGKTVALRAQLSETGELRIGVGERPTVAVTGVRIEAGLLRGDIAARLPLIDEAEPHTLALYLRPVGERLDGYLLATSSGARNHFGLPFPASLTRDGPTAGRAPLLRESPSTQGRRERH